MKEERRLKEARQCENTLCPRSQSAHHRVLGMAGCMCECGVWSPSSHLEGLATESSVRAALTRWLRLSGPQGTRSHTASLGPRPEGCMSDPKAL